MDKKYKQIEFFAGNTIEQAVNELLTYKEKGQIVYGKFNGITLYSDTVTMDSAYQEITGKSKVEFDKEQQDWIENYKSKKQEHKQKIPELSKMWMQKGREILAEDKWEYWDEIVPIRLGDLYEGMELGNCLNIIKELNKGDLEKAKEVIENQNHSGMSFSLVCAMVKEFSDKGLEFVEYVS